MIEGKLSSQAFPQFAAYGFWIVLASLIGHGYLVHIWPDRHWRDAVGLHDFHTRLSTGNEGALHVLCGFWFCIVLVECSQHL